MIIALFLSFAQCDTAKVPYLTSPEFREYVLKRKEGEVWTILFVAMNEQKCVKAEEIFRKTAITMGNTVNFAVINLTEEPIIARRLKIGYVPFIKVYSQNGGEDYFGKLTIDDITEFLTQRMPNNVRIFERKWTEEPLSSVVLFTDQIKAPSLWTTLSIQHNEEYLRFGICSEFHIHREFGISRLPTIMFINSTHQIKYHGEFNISEINQEIQKFLDGTIEIVTKSDNEGFYRMSEFKDQCYGRDYCILHTGSAISEKYRQIRLLSRKLQMKFFYGDNNLPFSIMKKGQYYIWNPRRKGIIKAQDIDELQSILDRVVDGGAKFAPISEYKEDEL